jgi:NitT/TauT family transport system substrate-binding protein
MPPVRFAVLAAILLAALLRCTAPGGTGGGAPAAPARGASGPSAAGPSAGPAVAAAPTAPRPEALRVGFANVTAVHAALLAADEGGLFARNGLDVDLVNLGPSQTVQAALLSGEAPVASVSGSSTLNVILAGGDLAIVGAVFDTMHYQLATTPDVSDLAGLRGKIIGVNRFGGAADSILRYVLKQSAIEPERDLRILQVGAQTERLAALRSGAIQATLVDPPFQVLAEREGLRILLDTADLGLAYPQDVLVMSRQFVAARGDVARRTLQSVVDGARAFRQDRDLGLRTISRWLKLEDPALLDDTYAYFSRLMPVEVLPRADGLRLVIDEVAAENPAARQYRPEDLIDPSVARDVK